MTTIKAALAGESEVVRDAAATSAGELGRDIDALEQEVDRVRKEIAAQEEKAKALNEAVAALEVRRFDSAAAAGELDQARQRIRELEAEVSDAKSDDRVVFTLPKGFSKRGWLVVLSAESLAAAPIGVEASPTDFGSDEGAFLEWAAGKRSDYFLLLIRPSGTDVFDTIEEAFRTRGITYGYDVVGANTKLLHPVRGAAP